MAAKQPPKPSKVMDVSKPGKTAPAGNSRGVIIPRRSVMADPMVNEQQVEDTSESSENASSTPSPALGGSGKTLQPLTAPPLDTGKSKATKTKSVAEDKDSKPLPEVTEPEPLAAQDSSNRQPTIAELAEAGASPELDQVETAKASAAETLAPETDASTTPDTEKEDEAAVKVSLTQTPAASEPAATQSPEPAKPAPETDENISKESSEKDPVVDPLEQEAAQQAEREAAIEKLVEDKHFFLPIKTVEQRRTKRTLILGIFISLLLGVAWLNVALDSGIVNLGVNLPHTHFFDSQNEAKPAVSTAKTTPTPGQSVTTLNVTPLGLQFKYPAKWEVMGSDDKVVEPKTVSTTIDTLLIQPKGTVANAVNDAKVLAKGTVLVYLQNDDPANSGATPVTYTVKAVEYKKLAHDFSSPVYLRDVIFQSSTGVISLVSNLTNSNTDSVGKTHQTNVQPFTSAEGKSVVFQALALKSNDNGVGFKTVEDAQSFLKSSQYQQARNILLSAAQNK